MADTDWADVSGILTSAALAFGSTGALTPPNGGGTFVYGYNSLDGTVSGAHGKFIDDTNFKPTGTGLSNPDGGGQISGTIKRLPLASYTGFTPYLFACAQGAPPSVNDTAYMIGLSDESPYRIVLAKATLNTTLSAGATSILAQSTAQYAIADDDWHHLRLDVIVQPNKDVLLKVYDNDLTVNNVAAPVWVAVPGISDYIDDALQINTGSAPLLGGYWGFGLALQEALNAGAAFDAIRAAYD